MNLLLPPEFYTPEFWRARAEEWRGPVNQRTATGICWQCTAEIGDRWYWDINYFMTQYRPEGIKSDAYFFPKTAESRPLRAALCERIAADMAKLARL